MTRRPGFCFLFLAASLGLVACSPRGEPSATSSGSVPDASLGETAASAKTAEQSASAVPSAVAISPEPYLVMMEEIGALHTRYKRDCPKMAKELEAYLEAHEAEIRAPDKRVAVAIEADPVQKARMKAAMTAVMDGSAPCRSAPAFTKLMEKLRGEPRAPNP